MDPEHEDAPCPTPLPNALRGADRSPHTGRQVYCPPLTNHHRSTRHDRQPRLRCRISARRHWADRPARTQTLRNRPAARQHSGLLGRDRRGRPLVRGLRRLDGLPCPELAPVARLGDLAPLRPLPPGAGLLRFQPVGEPDRRPLQQPARGAGGAAPDRPDPGSGGRNQANAQGTGAHPVRRAEKDPLRPGPGDPFPSAPVSSL